MGTSPPNSEWFDEEKIVSNPLALILGCRIRLYNFFNFSLFRQGLYIEKKLSIINYITRNLFIGEKVQKWTHYFLLLFPTRPSDEYDSQRRVKNTRVHFWT